MQAWFSILDFRRLSANAMLGAFEVCVSFPSWITPRLLLANAVSTLRLFVAKSDELPNLGQSSGVTTNKLVCGNNECGVGLA